MKKLKKYEQYVLDTLEKNVLSRSSDFILYGAVLRRMGIDLNMTLGDFLKNAEQNKMPPFESITRCRRHIQALRTDLQESKTAVKRQDAEIDYKIYNLSGIGEN